MNNIIRYIIIFCTPNSVKGYQEWQAFVMDFCMAVDINDEEGLKARGVTMAVGTNSRGCTKGSIVE